MENIIAQTSTNVLDLVLVVSMLYVKISQETTLVYARKDSKVIRMMDASILMSVHIKTLVDQMQFVRISRAVIAATVPKDSMEMQDPLAVSTITNVLVHRVVEMRTARTRSAHLGASVRKVLKVIQ